MTTAVDVDGAVLLVVVLDALTGGGVGRLAAVALLLVLALLAFRSCLRRNLQVQANIYIKEQHE